MSFADRPRGWERTTKRILARDRRICWLCGKSGATSVDHVLARANGGGHEDANLRAAHVGCNSRKGDRDTMPSGPPRMHPPRVSMPRSRGSRWH